MGCIQSQISGYTSLEKGQPAPPVITHINPTKGFSGCRVYIHGTDITNSQNGRPRVIFLYGDTAKYADYVSVYDYQTIGVVIPDDAIGSVAIYVQTKSGLSQPANYTIIFCNSPPTITGIAKAGQGNWVYVNGSNFTKKSMAKLDSIPVLTVHIYSTEQLGLFLFDKPSKPSVLVITTENGSAEFKL